MFVNSFLKCMVLVMEMMYVFSNRGVMIHDTHTGSNRFVKRYADGKENPEYIEIYDAFSSERPRQTRPWYMQEEKLANW